VTYGSRLAVLRVDYASSNGQALARRYQVRAHPTIVVIDAHGAAQLNLPGVPDQARVQQAIRDVLAQEQ
jgi:thioredoxin-related protein